MTPFCDGESCMDHVYLVAKDSVLLELGVRHMFVPVCAAPGACNLRGVPLKVSPESTPDI